jgi:hypothetical protein
LPLYESGTSNPSGMRGCQNKQYYWKDVDKSRSKSRERYWKMKNDPVRYQKYRERHREYQRKYSEKKKVGMVKSSADQK